MAIAEHASSPASIHASQSTSSITSASFTPPVGSLVVAMAAFDWDNSYSGSPSMVLSDSNGGDWQTFSENGGTADSELVAIGYTVITSSVPMTVTATGPDSTLHTELLTVKVYTGAATSGTIANLLYSNHASGSTNLTQQTVTTTTTGSLPVLVFAKDNGRSTQSFAANANTTQYDGFKDTNVSSMVLSGRATNLTGTPGSVSLGWTSGGSQMEAGVILEILPGAAAPTAVGDEDTSSSSESTSVSVSTSANNTGSLTESASISIPIPASDTGSIADSASISISVADSDTGSQVEDSSVAGGVGGASLVVNATPFDFTVGSGGTVTIPAATAGNKLIVVVTGDSLVTVSGFSKKTTYPSGNFYDLALFEKAAAAGGETSVNISTGSESGVVFECVPGLTLQAVGNPGANNSRTIGTIGSTEVPCDTSVTLPSGEGVLFTIFTAQTNTLTQSWSNLQPVTTEVFGAANDAASDPFVYLIGVVDVSATDEFPNSNLPGVYNASATWTEDGDRLWTCQVLYANATGLTVAGGGEVTPTSVNDSDTGSMTEIGSVAVPVATSDTGSLADGGTVAVAVSGSDTSAQAESTAIAGQLSATDASHQAEDQALSASFTATDSSAGTDAGLVDVGQGDGDSGALTESSSVSSPTAGGDSGHSAEAGSVAATLGAADSATAAEGASIAATLPGHDTATSAETESLSVQVSNVDTTVLAESGSVTVGIIGHDSGTLHEAQQITGPDKFVDHTLSAVVKVLGRNATVSLNADSATVFATSYDATDALVDAEYSASISQQITSASVEVTDLDATDSIITEYSGTAHVRG